MASEIHVNDVGTRFLITIKEDDVVVDITNATTIAIYIARPDDSMLARTGTVSDAVNGQLYYDIQAGDLNEAGHYKLQARVTLNTGTYYTSIYNFQAHCNVEDI
tara:strand:+ start:1629 stop:1940 length:312 start_codon:yes stop_codon:yes gene_type:complete